MSGGHFDYIQFRIEDVVDSILKEINTNEKKPDWIDDEYWIKECKRKKWKSKTIREFRKAIKIIDMAKIYIHRIDWLICGDDDEEDFHKRLKEELKQC